MPQITIHLDDELATHIEQAARKRGVSESQWVAEAVRLRSRTEWQAAVRALAGAWPTFPDAAEIRARSGKDLQRETL